MRSFMIDTVTVTCLGLKMKEARPERPQSYIFLLHYNHFFLMDFLQSKVALFMILRA